MQVVLVTQKRDSEVTMKLLIFIGCVLLLATVRATFYDAIFEPSLGEEFVDVNINSFQSSVGDLPNEVPANDDIQADKTCDACLSFYDTMKKPGMRRLMFTNCVKLPAANQKYCFGFVNQILFRRATRDGICKKMGFCNSHALIDVQSNNDVSDLDFANEEYSDAQTCTSCVNLLTVMKQVEAVETKMKGTCEHSHKKTNCENFVATLFKLIRSVPAEKACEEAQFCTKNTYWIGYGKTEQQPESGQAEEDNDVEIAAPQLTQTSTTCKICEDLVGILQSPGYQTMVQKRLKDLCEQLPEPFREIVKVAGVMYLEKFTASINMKTAKGFCVEHFKCMEMSEEQSEEKDQTGPNYQLAEDLNSNCACQICVNMMTIFENHENQNHMMKIIESFFEYMPEPFRELAKPIILTYARHFLEIVNKNPPKEFCINHHICKSLKEKPSFGADAYIIEVAEVY